MPKIRPITEEEMNAVWDSQFKCYCCILGAVDDVVVTRNGKFATTRVFHKTDGWHRTSVTKLEDDDEK